MANRRPPNAFSIERGKAMRDARGHKSQEEIARALDMTRNAISLYESGHILMMDVQTAKKVMRVLGLPAEKLLEDPSHINATDAIPEVSPEARQVASQWDGMPASLRFYLRQQMQTWKDFVTAAPAVSKLMGTASEEQLQREQEVLYPAIEKFQAAARAKNVRPHKKVDR